MKSDHLRITVKTSSASGDQGTDDKVYIRVYNRGKGWVELGRLYSSGDDFEKGKTGVYEVPRKGVDAITAIEYRKTGSDGWGIGTTTIWDPQRHTTYYFNAFKMWDNNNWTPNILINKVRQGFKIRVQGRLNKNTLSTDTYFNLKLYNKSGKSAMIYSLINGTNDNHVKWFRYPQCVTPYEVIRTIDSSKTFFGDVSKIAIYSRTKSKELLEIDWIELTDIATGKKFTFSGINSANKFSSLAPGKWMPLTAQKLYDYDITIGTSTNSTSNDLYLNCPKIFGDMKQLIANYMSSSKEIKKELKLPKKLSPGKLSAEEKLELKLSVGTRANTKDSWGPTEVTLVDKQTGKQWLYVLNHKHIRPNEELLIRSYGKFPIELAVKTSEVSGKFSGKAQAYVTMKGNRGGEFNILEPILLKGKSTFSVGPGTTSFNVHSPEHLASASKLGFRTDSSANWVVDYVSLKDGSKQVDFPFRKQIGAIRTTVGVLDDQLIKHSLKLDFGSKKCVIGADNFLMVMITGLDSKGNITGYGPIAIKPSSSGTIPLTKTILLNASLTSVTGISIYPYWPLAKTLPTLDVKMTLTNSVTKKVYSHSLKGIEFPAVKNDKKDVVKIKIKTEDSKYAATNDKVYILIYHSKGTTDFQLNNPGVNDFEVDQTDNYILPAGNIGEITSIRYRKTGSNGWSIGKTEVFDERLRKRYYFDRIGMLDNTSWTKHLTVIKSHRE